MIYSLRGKLIHTEPGFAVVECGGVGYKCAASLSTLSQLPPKGSEVLLYTYLSVREDALDLFGFFTQRELDSFRLLTSVNGVGAKVALSLLSDLSADKLALAVASGDAKTLTKCAGVGNKIAQRIVLELKDKLAGFGEAFEGVGAAAAPLKSHGSVGEALEALVALGYTQSEAAVALAGCDDSMKAQDMIKKALKSLAGRA